MKREAGAFTAPIPSLKAGHLSFRSGGGHEMDDRLFHDESCTLICALKKLIVSFCAPPPLCLTRSPVVSGRRFGCQSSLSQGVHLSHKVSLEGNGNRCRSSGTDVTAIWINNVLLFEVYLVVGLVAAAVRAISKIDEMLGSMC